MLRLFALLINLIVPGSGFVLLGRWYLAGFTQLLLIAMTLVLCLSRWVFDPAAIELYLISAGVVTLISTLLCLTVAFPASPLKTTQTAIVTTAFIVTCLSGFFAGFVYKHHWLGVHVYFVPSMSMHPTLKPGQFILLDTWIYNNHYPQPNHVIVFTQGNPDQWLVKRISKWPDGKSEHNGLWYVLGDNRNHSHDSRQFGGVITEQIVGQVKLTLIGIDQHRQIQLGNALQVIR